MSIDRVKARETPPAPKPLSKLEAVTYSLATRWRRSQHGQLCPVWTKSADVHRCNCWRLSDAKQDAEQILEVIRRWDESH